MSRAAKPKAEHGVVPTRLNLELERAFAEKSVSYSHFKRNVRNHFLVSGDVKLAMEAIPSNSIGLIITDPPYNIGLRYGKYSDKLGKKEYFEWCHSWLTECSRVLSNEGSMYLISYPEINAYLMPFLDETIALKFRRWITWNYPTNIGHSPRNFTRSQRSILFYTKSDKYVFNRQRIIQHYKNPEVGKIKRRIQRGILGRGSYDLLRYPDLLELNRKLDAEDALEILELTESHDGLIDVLEINLMKNVSKERMNGHPCQLPLGLIRILTQTSSNPGTWVLDPFAGTFSVSMIASSLGRNSIGIDQNPEYVGIGLKRLGGSTGLQRIVRPVAGRGKERGI